MTLDLASDWVPSKGEGNQEQSQEGGIRHSEGEIFQEQNQEEWCLEEGVRGCLMNISSCRVVSGVFVDGSGFLLLCLLRDPFARC